MAGSRAPSPSWPALAIKDAVNASIFFSNSATRLSVFFWRFRLGAVTIHCLFAFAHLLHEPVGLFSSGSQRTLSCRHASQARERFRSLGSDGFPVAGLVSNGLSWDCTLPFA